MPQDCLTSDPFAGERANKERQQALSQLVSETDGFMPEEGLLCAQSPCCIQPPS